MGLGTVVKNAVYTFCLMIRTDLVRIERLTISCTIAKFISEVIPVPKNSVLGSLEQHMVCISYRVPIHVITKTCNGHGSVRREMQSQTPDTIFSGSLQAKRTGNITS